MTFTYPLTGTRSCSRSRRAGSRWLAPTAARFLTHAAPRVELAALLLALAGRLLIAAKGQAPTWRDAAVLGALVAVLPFAEWAVHAKLLHAKPISWRGRQLQSAAAKAHAAHHADPRDERLVVTPLQALLPLPLLALGIVAVLPSWSLRTTAAAGLSLLLLSTEWTHFLAHAPIQPTSAWLRRRIRTHRLHHFRNDQYWFGLTSGIADAILRTGPSRDATSSQQRSR